MKRITISRQEQVCPATGESFIPDRDNQTYKNRAVQIKHNNEQAKFKRKDLKELNDRIISNKKKINKLNSTKVVCSGISPLYLSTTKAMI